MKDPRFCPHCGGPLVSQLIDGKTRLCCPESSANYVHWNNPVPVVTAMIEYNGGIILARNKAWPEKVFGLITGFLESGETPEQGIIREIREELGLEGTVGGFIGLFPFFQMNQLLIAYDVKASGTLAPGDELAEVKSVLPEKVRPWNFGTGYVVKAWLEMKGIIARQP